MIVLRLLPVMFADLIFAAHYSRAGHDWLAILILILPLSFFIRKTFIVRAWQIIMAFSALVWLKVTFDMVQIRISMETPWLRLVLILGAIALFSAFCAWWLENKKIKAFYGFDV